LQKTPLREVFGCRKRGGWRPSPATVARRERYLDAGQCQTQAYAHVMFDESFGMWRWTNRIVIGFSGLLIAGAVAGAMYQWLATRRDLIATPLPGRLIDVGGHRLHVWCTGTGVPPVILETGLTGSTADWGFVQPEVAKFTRVCSYDRARRGYSDPGPSPRTARRIARELAVLLDRSDTGGPFVLVGPPAVVSRSACLRLNTVSRWPVSFSWMRHTKIKRTRFRSLPDLSRFSPPSAPFDCGVCHSVRVQSRWRRRSVNSRARRASVPPGTERRRMKSFTFGRAQQRSARLDALCRFQ